MRKNRRQEDRRNDRRAAYGRRAQWMRAGCGAVTALAIMVMLGIQLLPLVRHEHHHPVAVHGGQIVPLGDENSHYHIEVVVNPTGLVMLYPLGSDSAETVAAETQRLIAKAKPVGAEEFFDVVFRPAPQAVRDDGRTTAFIGRLPGDAISGHIVIRFASFRIGGKAFDFEVESKSPRPSEEIRAEYEADQRRIYLTAGGKYTDADIAFSGRVTASAKFRGHRAGHLSSPRAGEKVCPITGIKATSEIAWRVSGDTYLFCCQPCVDDFVMLAKERPGEIRGPEEYVGRP
jgi:hypothetical protein